MGKFNVSDEDINYGKPIETAWYPFKLKNIKDKPASTDGSNVTHIRLVGLPGTPAENVPVLATFSEKAPGMIVKLWKALNPGVVLKAGMLEVDKKYEGRDVDVYIGHDTYKGQTVNKAVDFRPLVKR